MQIKRHNWSEQKLYFFLKELEMSDREIEVVKAMLELKSSKQIASELHVSLNTIKTHKRHIYNKTNSRDSSSFLKFLYENGLYYI